MVIIFVILRPEISDREGHGFKGSVMGITEYTQGNSVIYIVVFTRCGCA